MQDLCPVFLRVHSIKCLVVGGGRVAYRKALFLLGYGAEIILVSPEIIIEIQELAEQGIIKHIRDFYSKTYLDGMKIVIGATSDSEINLKIYQDCLEQDLLVNIVDNPELGNFFFPAVVKRGSMQLAISTGGKSPLLAKKIKIQLEKEFPVGYEDLLELLGKTRRLIIENNEDFAIRSGLLSALLDKEIMGLIWEGKLDLAKERIKDVYPCSGS
ncbi:MAG: bifunctional precorrin-2 dehydrogenase/sirohydrochlorin ferrochelatase [Peptococcaceae bacterium]|nr:bifunctional precorrin-2 dehydrogenase/sirohydrochlorin ferrochelatase [Peptococcaceae bacterium]